VTILKDLPVGSLVKDPSTKYNGKPIIWRIVGHNAAGNAQGYPVDSTTLMSKDIISIKTFDAKEPGNTNSFRKTSGNNRWMHSNIRQWLNSESPAPWFSATHTADEPPSSGTNGNSYDSEAGFLSFAGSDFKNAILESSLKNNVPTVDGGNLETTIDKVFLFSMTELGFQGSTGKEGAIIPYLNNSATRTLVPTQEAVDQSTYKHTSLTAGNPYYHWMRSSYPSFSHIAYRVSTNGAYTQSIADNDTIGIAPATNLDTNATISHKDTDGVYVLAFTAIAPVDMSKIVFKLTETVSKKDIVVGTEGKFSGGIKLDWNADTASIGYTIDLKYNGANFAYTRGQTLSALGKYTAVITATDKATPSNQRVSDTYTFSILPPRKDLPSLGFKIMDNNTSTEITEGAEYTGKVIPSWQSINDVTITVTYAIDTVAKGNLPNGGTQTTAGNYQVSYLLTDNNYPDNQLTGILNFKVLTAPIDWGEFDLNLKDVITSKEIVDNSEFEEKVNPTWDVDPNVTYNVTMLYEGSLISYSKGNVLTNLGNYTIKFKLTDKSYPTNTHNIDVPFKVIAAITDLTFYEPVFLDVNLPVTANDTITEGRIFKDTDIKPYWENFPADVKAVAYSIRRDGTLLPFTPNTDIYSDYGKYEITLTLENGAGNQRTYKRNFEITTDEIDIDITIFNVLDGGSEITEGRIFEETQVIPDWEDPEGTGVFYTLKYEGSDMDFMKGSTILSLKGEYTLELIIEDLDSPTNTETLTRKFKITDRKIEFGKIDLTIYNDITGVPIYNNDVYKGIYVLPQWNGAGLPPDVLYESWITHNGTKRDYDRMSDPAFNTIGDYVLEVKVIDPNFPTNFKIVTRTFKIIADSIDLGDKEIIIKNKITNSEIKEGEIFRGENAAVQPTWSEYPGMKYTYRLWRDGVLVSTYKKEDILRVKGNYRLSVEAVDPNYPENKLSASVTFSIMDELKDGGSGDGYEEAYLNALPYTMGTPITKSGDYNLLVVRRKKTNFKVSMSEVNFKVTRPDEEQKPLIMINPEVIPSIEDEITIRYPSWATEEEYKIDGGEWRPYLDPFKVTDNCTITARYRDPLGYFVSGSEDVTNIDKLPPAPPVLLGFKDGVDTYLTITANVEWVYGVDFTATLNGEPYELGTPIYNEVPEVKEYTLIVTAKKRLNGLTATTIRKFTLDSVPPLPPNIVGVLPDIIQESARPDVDGFKSFTLTKNEYMLQNDFEARLNGRLFTLGTLVNDPGSYQVSVTAIKKINGLRATSWVVFTIVHEMPEPIGPLRISLEPLTEDNKDIAVDGELIVDRTTGHISIYDDGYLISKTRELEEMLDILDKRIVAIDITLQSNEARINSLKIMLNRLRADVAKLQGMNFTTENDINYMNSIVNYLDFVDLSILKDFEKELAEIDAITNQIRTRIDQLKAKLNGKIELALQIMDGLQNNSSLIGEVIWLKNTKSMGRP
jgi:Family of unknown function (DUF6273)